MLESITEKTQSQEENFKETAYMSWYAWNVLSLKRSFIYFIKVAYEKKEYCFFALTPTAPPDIVCKLFPLSPDKGKKGFSVYPFVKTDSGWKRKNTMNSKFNDIIKYVEKSLETF